MTSVPLVFYKFIFLHHFEVFYAISTAIIFHRGRPVRPATAYIMAPRAAVPTLSEAAILVGVSITPDLCSPACPIVMGTEVRRKGTKVFNIFHVSSSSTRTFITEKS
mgnify:CR=1 FL=1